jgi:uncharacterized protein (TIGR03435 family)
MLRIILLTTLATLAAGQQPPAFEVASIRPIADATSTQANAQITQAQARFTGLPLKTYVAIAFKVQQPRIVCPDWMGSTRFDIVAKLPDGAQVSEVPDMLQTLLAQRFNLQAHRENRESAVYALEIARGGLTAARVPADRDVVNNGAVVAGGSGSAQGISVDLGRGSSYQFADSRFEAKKLNMAMLAQALQNYVGRPIVDMTNDDGFYDFTLTVTPEDFLAMRIRAAQSAGVALPAEATRLLDSASIDSLAESLAKLGITLQSRRAPLEYLVVDRVEKTPTEN